MAITDSTAGGLATSWQEEERSSFTAGVLSDIAACAAEVEGKLRRGTLGVSSSPTLAQVKNWLRRAKLELMEDRNYTFSRKYAYCDLSSGAYRYAMPPDYNGGEVKLRDITAGNSIPIWLPAWFDKHGYNLGNAESGDIQAATIVNDELWLYPPPSSSNRIELEYSRDGSETTADDFSYLPELARFRCCDFALSHSFESLHQFEVADRYRQYWELGLAKMRKADARRKWAGKRLAVINVFQEYANQGKGEGTGGGGTGGGGGITFGGEPITW